MRARLHRYPRWRNIAEPLLDGFRCGSEAASVNYVSVLGERAVMAPDISKVDTDRHLDPGPSAWNFRNEVLRRVFHGNSLSPFRKACSSHFSRLILDRSSPQARVTGNHLFPFLPC